MHFFSLAGKRIGVSNVHVPRTSIGCPDLSKARRILFEEVE